MRKNLCAGALTLTACAVLLTLSGGAIGRSPAKHSEQEYQALEARLEALEAKIETLQQLGNTYQQHPRGGGTFSPLLVLENGDKLLIDEGGGVLFDGNMNQKNRFFNWSTKRGVGVFR